MPFPRDCITANFPQHIRNAMYNYKECRNIPRNKEINGKTLPSHAMSGYNKYGIQWIAFSFESVSEMKPSLGFKRRIVVAII